MKYVFIIFFIFITSQHTFGQNSFNASVLDKKTNDPIPGAIALIKSIKKGAASDSTGQLKVINIPNGVFTIKISCIGYNSFKLMVTFPQTDPLKVKTILLEPSELEVHPIKVISTRTGNRIEDVPVRVEVLGSEEVNEEIAIKPGNISKLLGETSGIQVQQTSATSGNVSFRIQGLQGQYTQLLKDGFPLYGGLSTGLSLLQIPPLDLEQVEVIKGSSSTLYGGGAIAGIVNLISKQPQNKPKGTVLLNQTHKGGTDFSGFYSNRNEKLGITFLVSQSFQKAWDVNNDMFTDLPKVHQTTINPKLFYYFNDSTTLMGGITYFTEDRNGGEIYAVKNSPDSIHPYLEKNKSNRFTSQLEFKTKTKGGRIFTIKNSVNHFKRDISTLSNRFGGVQTSTYTELSYLSRLQHHDLVTGLTFGSDLFNEDISSTGKSLDYNQSTSGVFVQDDWKVSNKVILQAGSRVDYHSKYGTFFLPRFSALYKINKDFYARMTAALGYKTPTIFSDKAEEERYRNVLPISNNVRAETSQGINIDFNLQKNLFDVLLFTINQAIYYTRLNHPVILHPDSLSNDVLYYVNAQRPLIAKGFDTNLSFTLDELVLFVDYSYTKTQKKYDTQNPFLELTPKHKLNMTLSYEQEQSWRTGLEAFYTGKQYLSNQTQSRDYWTVGFMLEKSFRRFSIIGNVENIFDTRQTKFEDIVIPPRTNPTFRDIYAPLDGTVANVALEIKL